MANDIYCTQKVINEHSTIGLVVTTDGSVSDIPESEYREAEDRVINELKAINKPFAVIVNTTDTNSEACRKKVQELKERHGVFAREVNCKEMTTEEIKAILSGLLYEFPIKELKLDFPRWISHLEKSHPLRNRIFSSVSKAGEKSSFFSFFKRC